jgi:hypothetical protein
VQVPVLSKVQVFQKYSPGRKILPSGGSSLTNSAFAQFGSEGADANVGALVGVMTDAGVVFGLGSGVWVGATASAVSD